MPRSNGLAGKTLVPAAKENPWRKGSKGFSSFELFAAEHKQRDYKGVSYERLLELGVRGLDMAWGVKKGWISVK